MWPNIQNQRIAFNSSKWILWIIVVVLIQIRSRGYLTFSCSTQLSTNFILLIKCKNANTCWHFNIYEHDKTNLRELKQETPVYVGILVFICSWNLCSVELSMTKFNNPVDWVYSSSTWVPPGNDTITHCRPTQGTSREIHRTLTAWWKEKGNKYRIFTF